MAETLYREFKFNQRNLTGLSTVLRVFWAEAVVPFVLKGKSILLVITTNEAKRHKEQNARYFGYVLKHVAEQAWVNGQQFDKNVWHEWFARKFGVLEEMVMPDGEVITRRKSTTDMTVGEFTEYMNNVEANAAQELGVEFV